MRKFLKRILKDPPPKESEKEIILKRLISDGEEGIQKVIEADLKNRMTFHLGRDCVFYADFFKRKGDRLKACENLVKAIELFKECGADGLVLKAEKELSTMSRSHRFPIRLPIEYCQAYSSVNQTGEALNGSEGGLQVLLPEEMRIGQKLELKLLFSSGSELNVIKALVEVVWTNPRLGEGEKRYRSGVKFINISPEDVTRLKSFSTSPLPNG